MKVQISVEDSVRRILSTPLGSRVMNPDFGSRLHELIDRRLDNEFRMMFARYVFEALKKNEPRIAVERVTVTMRNSKLFYKIYLKDNTVITEAL